MSAYQYKDILKVSQSNLSNIEIDINDFLRDYIKIERNDKYEPIFSKTKKYKSFPINGNISKKNFINNNYWVKKENNINDLKLSFNKISFKNYEKIKNDIITTLKKDNIPIKNFIIELFDKISFDQKISNIYVKLCKDVWNEKLLLKKIIHVKIVNINNKKIYTYDNSRFNSMKSLYDNAYKKYTLKKYIINEIYKEFEKRHEYIQNILNLNDEDNIFHFKKKIFGTIEFIGLLYKDKHIDKMFLSNIINNLIKNNDLIEIESFIKLLKIINDDNLDYTNEIKNIINHITDKRLICLLETLLDKEDKLDTIYDFNYVNNEIINFKKENNIQKTLSNLKKVDNDFLLNELINNIADNFNIKIIELIVNSFLLKGMNNKDELIHKINNIEIDELDFPNGKINIEKCIDYINMKN